MVSLMGKTWVWVQTDIMPLTRELAEEIASLPHFEGDRPWESGEGRRRMAWLNHLVDEGKFYPPRWATAEYDGVLYRVNGGTSSHMLSNRSAFPNGLQVVIDRFLCESKADVADLFDQFDHRKSIRTMVQRVRAHKPAEPLLTNVSPTDINCLTSGISAAITDFGKVEEDGKVATMHSHSAFIAWAATFARKRHLRSRGVVAAIFDTYSKDSIYAKGFWAEVADDSNPDNTHPTRVLSEFLKEQIGLEAKRKFAAPAVHRKCIHAWNAARKNGKTALKLYKTGRKPDIT